MDPVEEMTEEVRQNISSDIILHDWDVEYWGQHDRLSERDKTAIQRIVREEFDPLIQLTTDTIAFPIVRRAQLFIESMLLVGLDVPFPRRVNRHVSAVVDNMAEVYYDLMDKDLREALRPSAMRRLNFNSPHT